MWASSNQPVCTTLPNRMLTNVCNKRDLLHFVFAGAPLRSQPLGLSFGSRFSVSLFRLVRYHHFEQMTEALGCNKDKNAKCSKKCCPASASLELSLAHSDPKNKGTWLSFEPRTFSLRTDCANL